MTAEVAFPRSETFVVCSSQPKHDPSDRRLLSQPLYRPNLLDDAIRLVFESINRYEAFDFVQDKTLTARYCSNTTHISKHGKQTIQPLLQITMRDRRIQILDTNCCGCIIRIFSRSHSTCRHIRRPLFARSRRCSPFPLSLMLWLWCL